MKPRESVLDDKWWDGVVEQMDLDLLPADLERAERELSETDDRPFPPAAAARIVAEVTRPPRRPWLGGRLRRLSWVAVLLLWAMPVATAATVAVIVWLWPAQERSIETMTYQMAMTLLGRSDAAARPDWDNRVSAMIVTRGLAKYGISVLCTVRDDPDAPKVVVARAQLRLAQLRALLMVEEVPRPASVDEGIKESAAAALDESTPEEQRVKEIDHIASLVASGISGLRLAPDLPPGPKRDRDVVLEALARELRR